MTKRMQEKSGKLWSEASHHLNLPSEASHPSPSSDKTKYGASATANK